MSYTITYVYGVYALDFIPASPPPSSGSPIPTSSHLASTHICKSHCQGYAMHAVPISSITYCHLSISRVLTCASVEIVGEIR